MFRMICWKLSRVEPMLEVACATMEALTGGGLTQPAALHAPAWLLQTEQKKGEQKCYSNMCLSKC